jgi:hypothetical protein
VNEWNIARNRLVDAVVELGFPQQLGDAMAQQLGSPKAMDRLTSYLVNVQPHSAELIVDEMLAFSSDISAWKDKKGSLAANANYNDYLNRDL